MIREIQKRSHSNLPGVTILPLGDDKLRSGQSQQVLVTMEPGVQIPLHYHAVMATMDPVAGWATVLSEDGDNGRKACPGMRIDFLAGSLHGFHAGSQGFSFVSTNGGIVDDSTNWDIHFVS